MNAPLSTVAFDADDTLWHNERFFEMTQAHFADLLRDHSDRDNLMERLLASERRNLGHYGFGVKGFTLSMIETALEVTDNRVSGTVIAQLLEAGREMLRHPVELLPDARRAVEAAKESHKILLITKGDLLDQERKLAQSGLGELFDGVEVVSSKEVAVYRAIFARHGADAERSLMVGNSMKSDVLPVLEAGGWAIHVPYRVTWDLEKADPPLDQSRFFQMPHLGEFPALLSRLSPKAG